MNTYAQVSPHAITPKQIKILKRCAESPTDNPDNSQSHKKNYSGPEEMTQKEKRELENGING